MKIMSVLRSTLFRGHDEDRRRLVAQGAIRARMMGDDFQSHLFWLYGSMLFLPGRYVSRIQVESIEGGALDDLVVDYSVTLEDSSRPYTREYIQCKFHVGDAKTYSSAALRDPAFFSTTESFLTRAYAAYRQFTDEGRSFLLVLVSNGDWDSRDKLKNEIAEGGALRDRFFTSGPRSDIGKIRISWRDHLRLSDEEAEAFFRSLRLRYRWQDQRGQLHSIDAHARLIGLSPIDDAHFHNVYDAVYRGMVENGQLDFDRDSFSTMCQQQGLGTPREPSVKSVRSAGLRSYMRAAAYVDLECDPFICLCEYFDGRSVRDAASWNGDLVTALRTWCEALAEVTDDCELRLECHPSISYAAGRLIGPRPRAQILPMQGSKIGGGAIWAPGDSGASVAWSATDIPISPEGSNVAVALSITHDVTAAVTALLKTRDDLGVSVLRVYTPATGPGHTAIPNGAAGWALAEELAADMGGLSEGQSAGVIHLFGAVPNALSFLLGRMQRPGVVVQTWEHNGDGTLEAMYVEAIRLH